MVAKKAAGVKPGDFPGPPRRNSAREVVCERLQRKKKSDMRSRCQTGPAKTVGKWEERAAEKNGA